MPQLLDSAELSGARTRVRSGVVTPFANELFVGEILFFVRDPAMRMPTTKTSHPLWELQIQGRFRKACDGLYMGMEATEVIKMNFLMRGVAAAFLSYVRTIEPALHYSFGERKPDASGAPSTETESASPRP